MIDLDSLIIKYCTYGKANEVWGLAFDGVHVYCRSGVIHAEEFKTGRIAKMKHKKALKLRKEPIQTTLF